MAVWEGQKKWQWTNRQAAISIKNLELYNGKLMCIATFSIDPEVWQNSALKWILLVITIRKN
jgi:hypothetical protein